MAILFYIAFNKTPDIIDYIFYNVGQRTSGIYNPALLSHRLVKEDVRLFPDHQNRAMLAWGNINDFLMASALKCSGIKEPRQFLSCSNDVLGKKFYYQPSDLTSEGWSHHASDCDLNVYLLYDAAKQKGIDLKIVYFPWHALIAFKDDVGGNWVQWETTLNNNHGGLAERADPRYIKTPDKFFSSPTDMAVAEMIYPLMIIPHIHTDAVAISEFNKLSGQTKETPFYKDLSLAIHNLASPMDIGTLSIIMAERPTSTGIKYLAAQWYISHGMNLQAAKLLSAVAPDKCPNYCLKILSAADAYYTPDSYITAVLGWAGMEATRKDVKSVYILSLILLGLCTCLIVFNRKSK